MTQKEHMFQEWLLTMNLFENKKVLLRERKRHTTRRVASTHSAVLLPRAGGGYPHPVLMGVPHPVPMGYPHPVSMGEVPIMTWLGYLSPSVLKTCTHPPSRLEGTWDQALGYPQKGLGPIDGRIMGWRWGTPLLTDRHL